MTELQTLKLRITRLENIVNSLMGMQEGVISRREAREALERGDKLTWEKFQEQEMKRRIGG